MPHYHFEFLDDFLPPVPYGAYKHGGVFPTKRQRAGCKACKAGYVFHAHLGRMYHAVICRDATSGKMAFRFVACEHSA